MKNSCENFVITKKIYYHETLRAKKITHIHMYIIRKRQCPTKSNTSKDFSTKSDVGTENVMHHCFGIMTRCYLALAIASSMEDFIHNIENDILLCFFLNRD